MYLNVKIFITFFFDKSKIHWQDKILSIIINIYEYLAFLEPLKNADLIQSDPSGDMPEKCSVPPSMPPISGIYDYKYRYSVAESTPGLIHNSSVIIHNSPVLRRRPPSPPKRQTSHPNDLQSSIGNLLFFFLLLLA